MTLAELFPLLTRPGRSVTAEIGPAFETLTLPSEAGQQLLSARTYPHQEHPVGAVVAQGGEMVLLVPPGSSPAIDWPTWAVHRGDGVLTLPPLGADAADGAYWVRAIGRAFTRPRPLRMWLDLLALVARSCHSAGRP